MFTKLLSKLNFLKRNLTPVGSYTESWSDSYGNRTFTTYLFFRTKTGRPVCTMTGYSPKEASYYHVQVLPWLNGVLADDQLILTNAINAGPAEAPRKLALVK